MKNRKYIVYITYYKGDLLPPFYIGSSYEEKIKRGYNGSIKSKKWSSIYKKEQEENKHLFKTKILSYHETREEALKEELRLQKKHNVVKNNKYFNESYASVNGMFGRDIAGKLHPMYGNTHSEESMKQMIETSKRDIDRNGDNLLVRKSIKASETMRNDIDKNGNNGLKRKSLKSAKTVENTIAENGKTIRENMTNNRLNTINKNKKRYILFDNDNNIYKKNLLMADIKRISRGLQNTSETNRIGIKQASKRELIKKNKEWLIGYYIKEI